MTDIGSAGGAPAPAEPSAAPIDTNPGNGPAQPLGSQVPPATEGPDGQRPDPNKRPLREALEKASQQSREKIEKAEKDAPPKPSKEPSKEQPKAPAKAEPAPKVEGPNPFAAQRGEHGHFAPREAPAQEPAPAPQAAPQAPAADAPAAPHHVAPSRFHDEAKAGWETTPEPVKAETHRALRELESGIEEHRKRWEPIKPFHELATQNGTDIPSALNRYVAFEMALKQNPVEGLAHIARDMGFDLKQVAAHILKQPAPTPDAQSQTIARLEARIGQLSQQVSGVTGTIQNQQQEAVRSQVNDFASSEQYARFDELSEDIAFFLQSGKVPDDLPPQERLSQAYALAERLNPAPAKAQAAPVSPAPPAPPLNPAGQKSISGAPATGSSPAPEKPAKTPSLRESLLRANKRVSASI